MVTDQSWTTLSFVVVVLSIRVINLKMWSFQQGLRDSFLLLGGTLVQYTMYYHSVTKKQNCFQIYFTHTLLTWSWNQINCPFTLTWKVKNGNACGYYYKQAQAEFKIEYYYQKIKNNFHFAPECDFRCRKRATLAEGKSWVFLSLAWNIWSECEHNKSFPRNEILK